MRAMKTSILDKVSDKNQKLRSKVMSKADIANELSSICQHKRNQMIKVLDALAEVVTKEVNSNGKITIPGIVMITKRYKPGRKAGKLKAFGKEVKFKAKAGHYVLRAFPVSPLKYNV